MLEINSLTPQHLPWLEYVFLWWPSAILDATNSSYLVMDAEVPAHPSRDRAGNSGKVWPVFAAVNTNCLCASKHLPYPCNWHGGSEWQAQIIMAGGYNRFAAPFPSSSSLNDPSLVSINTHTHTCPCIVLYSHTLSATSYPFCPYLWCGTIQEVFWMRLQGACLALVSMQQCPRMTQKTSSPHTAPQSSHCTHTNLTFNLSSPPRNPCVSRDERWRIVG